MQRILTAVLTGVCLLGLSTGGTASAQDSSRFFEPIPIRRLKADLNYLASDDLEGRGIGTKGLDLAADYIRDQFQKAGLKLDAVNGGPFQTFEMLDKVVPGESNRLILKSPDGLVTTGNLDEDFRPLSQSGKGQIEAPLVFGGYGIESDDPAYDDFKGLDLQGKAVIILRRTPQQGEENGLFGGDPHTGISRHAALRSKIGNARRKGAAAVLFVNDLYTEQSEADSQRSQLEKSLKAVLEQALPFSGKEPLENADRQREELTRAVERVQSLQREQEKREADPLIVFGSTGNPETDAIPVIQVRRRWVDSILQQSLKRTLKSLELQIDATGQPASHELAGWKVEIETSVTGKMTSVRNVIGVIPGEGALAEETVVIGAHYDHLGMGGMGSLMPAVSEIHNGADDNGSGTVALLELARRLASIETTPRRRIVLIAFTGEERGLIGSAEYVKNPVLPLESTVAMLNLDMVGRLTDESLTVFGTGTAKEWPELLKPRGEALRLEVVSKPEGFGPSDHSSFYSKQIPVLHFFTGTHGEYHRPADDVDRINFEGLDRIVSLTESMARWAAEVSTRPACLQVAGQARITQVGSRPYFGSIPDFSSSDSGYALQGVTPGSPADLAGLKSGDVIIRLEDQSIAGLDDFDAVLRRFKPGQEIQVTVRRDKKDVTIKVTLERSRE